MKTVRYFTLSEDSASVQVGVILQQFISKHWLQYPALSKFIENGAARWVFPSLGRATKDAFACLGKRRKKDSQLLLRFTITGVVKTEIVLHFFRIDSLNEVEKGAVESIYYYTVRLD